MACHEHVAVARAPWPGLACVMVSSIAEGSVIVPTAVRLCVCYRFKERDRRRIIADYFKTYI